MWKPDAIKLLICKLGQKQSVTSMSTTLTNTITTTGLELDQRRCYSFIFSLIFFFITIVVMQIVLNSCKLLVFKRYAMRRRNRLYFILSVYESSNEESSAHQVIYGDTLICSYCTPVHYNELSKL